MFAGLQTVPIDAADAYIGNDEAKGGVFIIKDDIVYVYDFQAKDKAPLLTATFMVSFAVANAQHPFNSEIAQLPSSMPSGITALHTSKLSGKIYAFVGSDFYISDWGTGSWSYQGRVICPIDL